MLSHCVCVFLETVAVTAVISHTELTGYSSRSLSSFALVILANFGTVLQITGPLLFKSLPIRHSPILPTGFQVWTTS